MNITCPHCSQTLELTPEVHAQLQGQPHFACPTCQGLMAVPPMPAASPKPAPRRPADVQKAAMHAQRGLNRNMLVLGVVALLALGGLATFLASRNGGNIFNIFQSTTNQIIHNSYFTQLIANGVTTEKDLQAIAEIRPYGEGFIGVSKAALDWSQALDLAKQTGAEVLDVETGSKQELMGWLDTNLREHLSVPAWVRDQGEAGVFAGSEILASKELVRQRKVILHWQAYPAEPKTLEEALLNYRWEWAPTLRPPYLLNFQNDGTASCPGLMWHWKIIGPQTAVAFDATDRGVRLPDFKATLQFDAKFTSLKAATDNGHFQYTGRRMGLKPHAVANDADFESLFNGRDLTGWSGDPQYWTVSDGIITAESPPGGRVPTDTYLIWQGGDVADFELRLSYKTTTGNSGVNYRSKVLDPAAWLVGGYQFEIDANRLPTNGGLYEDRGHRKAFVNPGGEYMANTGEKVHWSREGARTVIGNLGTKASLHSGDWNELIIICQGNHLTHQLNGITTIDLTDDDVSAKATSGVLALQLHSGSPQKVQFKDIRLKRL